MGSICCCIWGVAWRLCGGHTCALVPSADSLLLDLLPCGCSGSDLAGSSLFPDWAHAGCLRPEAPRPLPVTRLKLQGAVLGQGPELLQEQCASALLALEDSLPPDGVRRWLPATLGSMRTSCCNHRNPKTEPLF